MVSKKIKLLLLLTFSSLVISCNDKQQEMPNPALGKTGVKLGVNATVKTPTPRGFLVSADEHNSNYLKIDYSAQEGKVIYGCLYLARVDNNTVKNIGVAPVTSKIEYSSTGAPFFRIQSNDLHLTFKGNTSQVQDSEKNFTNYKASGVKYYAKFVAGYYFYNNSLTKGHQVYSSSSWANYYPENSASPSHQPLNILEYPDGIPFSSWISGSSFVVNEYKDGKYKFVSKRGKPMIPAMYYELSWDEGGLPVEAETKKEFSVFNFPLLSKWQKVDYSVNTDEETGQKTLMFSLDLQLRPVGMMIDYDLSDAPRNSFSSTGFTITTQAYSTQGTFVNESKLLGQGVELLDNNSYEYVAHDISPIDAYGTDKPLTIDGKKYLSHNAIDLFPAGASAFHSYRRAHLIVWGYPTGQTQKPDYVPEGYEYDPNNPLIIINMARFPFIPMRPASYYYTKTLKKVENGVWFNEQSLGKVIRIPFVSRSGGYKISNVKNFEANIVPPALKK